MARNTRADAENLNAYISYPTLLSSPEQRGHHALSLYQYIIRQLAAQMNTENRKDIQKMKLNHNSLGQQRNF